MSVHDHNGISSDRNCVSSNINNNNNNNNTDNFKDNLGSDYVFVDPAELPTAEEANKNINNMPTSHPAKCKRIHCCLNYISF